MIWLSKQLCSVSFPPFSFSFSFFFQSSHYARKPTKLPLCNIGWISKNIQLKTAYYSILDTTICHSCGLAYHQTSGVFTLSGVSGSSIFVQGNVLGKYGLLTWHLSKATLALGRNTTGWSKGCALALVMTWEMIYALGSTYKCQHQLDTLTHSLLRDMDLDCLFSTYKNICISQQEQK